MAAAGGLDGIVRVVKIAGSLIQVNGDAGIGTRVGECVVATAAVQGVGARQPFDDVGSIIAGQDVVVGRADDVFKAILYGIVPAACPLRARSAAALLKSIVTLLARAAVGHGISGT